MDRDTPPGKANHTGPRPLSDACSSTRGEVCGSGLGPHPIRQPLMVSGRARRWRDSVSRVLLATSLWNQSKATGDILREPQDSLDLGKRKKQIRVLKHTLE